MEARIRELLPHAPQIGLFAAPDIPVEKLRAAIGDYAPSFREEEVFALLDTTIMGSGKDGALFALDRFAFQNLMEPAQVVHYRDLIEVLAKRNLLGGRRIELKVNRARATFDLRMDLSNRAEASVFVERFLREAMQHSMATEMSREETDEAARLLNELERLHAAGKLKRTDYDRIERLLPPRQL